MKEEALKLADELQVAHNHCIVLEDLPTEVTDCFTRAEIVIRKLVAELDKQSEWGDSVVSKKEYQQAQLEARSYLLGYLDGKEGLEAKVRGEK
jgi:hypothetical protein